MKKKNKYKTVVPEPEEVVPQDDMEADVQPEVESVAETPPDVVDPEPEVVAEEVPEELEIETPQSTEPPSSVEELAHLVRTSVADPVLVSRENVDALVIAGHLNRNQMIMIKGRKRVVAVHPDQATKLG